MRQQVLLVMLILMSGSATAIDHPGCAEKDNDLCDSMAMLVNLRGKGCYRLMTVEPLGNSAYRLTCELASYDRSHITYTFKFTDGQKNYVLY